MSGYNLPPGVTQRMIDDAAGYYDVEPEEEIEPEHPADCTCRHCEPEPEDDEGRLIHSMD